MDVYSSMRHALSHLAACVMSLLLTEKQALWKAGDSRSRVERSFLNTSLAVLNDGAVSSSCLRTFFGNSSTADRIANMACFSIAVDVGFR